MIPRSLVVRILAFLWVAFPVCSAYAVLGGSTTQNGITITQNFDSVYYVDTKTSPFPTGYYAVYNITNNTSSALSDVWVTLGNFTGSTVYLSLGGNDTGVSHIGALAAGASKAAYFFLNVDCSAFTSGNCNISAAQGFTIDVYLGPPVDNLLASRTTNDITVADTIAASANKVTSGSVSTTTPSVGSTFTVTVNGSTGTIGGSNIFALSPETSTSFPADSFELVGTTLTFSNGGSGTYTDLLQIPISVISGISSANYTVTYTYRVTGTTSGTTTVQPIAYINSGAQIKHTTVSSLGNIPAIQPASNTLLLSMTVSPTSLGLSGGTATYTVHVTNSGSTAASLDEFIDALASSPDTENYVTGSSTFAGSAIADPTLIGSTAIWAGNFTVPANGSADLIFQTTIPSTVGTYTDFFYGLVSDSQIDTTADTSDDAEATTSITVSSQQTTTISISNLPASGAYGGSFTPAFSYTGDGTTSVVSNSTSVCTVTSGVVHYVSVGTCSLTAKATAGTHYTATTGTAQTFSIGQATPTVSISNLPASGTYGGSFTPTFSYTGDGTTSVSSNSTSVCTVTSGVVHYVGVGTCSLTASATAGTNYSAVTGSAQTFSVGQATATVAISNLPASGTYGGTFTPTYSYTGDGTSSVTSNSTSICTVTSGVVHYVGVGTCSLMASATAGTNYSAATGTAQTFSVSQATPTITVSNLPASGAYGGSFTPTYSYTGDGTTSVISNATSICTVTSGVVHYVGVGTCSLTAKATAGTDYAAVTGTAQTFSVGQATPTVTISNLPASGAYGGSFTPTFSYTGDGTTSVSSNSTSTCTVTSGVVHYVGVGTCSLTASATAGTNYAAVTGTAQTFSVGQATPTISISNLPASGAYGGSFTPTFSYTGDGTTSVSSNSTSTCTVTSGVVHYVGVGTCSLIASATAGTDYAAVTGTAQTFSVGQATPTISISNLPASGTYGGSFTPTFSYTGDGTTSVSSNSTSTCTVTSGVVHYVGVGTCSLSASAGAGTNYAAVTGTAQTFSVGQATPTISISNLPASGTYGGSFTPTFSYTGDGTTSVSSNSTGVCTVTSGVVHYVGVGTCSLMASATAGTNYAAATGTAQTFSVGKATPTISISNLPASGAYGGSFTPTFSYTGDGTTSITSNSASVCTVTSGVVHYVGVGSCSLTASASAGTNYSAVTGTAQTFTVGQATPTITISNLPATGTYGGSFTPTFSYTGDGTTSVSSNSVSVCTVTSGVVHYVGVGTCSLTASAAAGTNYSAVTGTAQTFSVSQTAPAISISNLPATGTYGGSFTPAFSYTGDGTTSVNSSSTSVCTVAAGVVHYVGVGTCSLVPSATAGTNYSAVTGTAQSFSVGRATPTISISNLPASGTYGGSFTPTFSYTGDGAASVSSNSASVCTVAGGVVHYVGVGTCSLTASAAVGTNYSAVTGAVQTFSVGQGMATVSISNLPANGTYGGSFTPVFSYTGDGTTSVASNSTNICTVAGGVVHYVGVGVCSLTASATAGTNYAAATGTAQTFGVGQGTATISISNLPATGTYGGSFTPAFSYTGDGAASVSSNSASVCTVAGGVVHYVGVGTCSLTASATAGTNYAAVTGTAQTFSVGKATATISISNLPATGTYGGSFTPAFSYTGDGTTTVTSNSAGVCTVTGGVVHYVGIGICSVTASATAGTNYAAVTGNAQTFSVGQATAAISISNLPANGTYGGSFTPVLSYTGDGTTSVSSNSASVCTVAGGVVHYVGVGICSVTASATAGTNYAAVTGTAQTFSVGQATATIAISNLPANGTYGDSFTPVFSYTGDGTASVASNSTGVCTVAGGVVHYVGVGTCSLTASATAGTNYAAVTGIAQIFSVGQAVATITLSNLNLTYTGSPQGGTVSVSPSGLAVTVTYNGSAVVPTAAGSYAMVATINSPDYSGSATGTLVIAPAAQLIQFAALPGQTVYGANPITLSATGGASGDPVVFSVLSGPGAVNGNRLGFTGAGTVVVAANQAGNNNYLAAPQVTQSIQVVSANLTFSPAALNFLDQPVGGTSQAQTLIISNPNNFPVTITGVQVSNSFNAASACGVLAPLANCSVNVTFTPTAAGPVTGTLFIANAESTMTQTVALTGTGIAASILVAPASLSFGSQTLSTTSTGQTVTIQNAGTQPLQLATAFATGDFAVGGNCSLVPASSNCSLTVTFTPTQTGGRAGSLTLIDSSGDQSQVGLSGTGTVASVSLTPGAQTFPPTPIGSTSQALTATLTNTGTSALTGITINLLGDFSQSSQCPVSLAPGAACTLNIVYAPTVAGADSGVLTVNDNLGSQTVALTGTGLTPGASIDNAQLIFGSQLINTSSLAQTVTVTNTGTGVLTIQSVTPTSNFSDTTNCIGQIAAGASCGVNVVFTPTTTGALSGTLTIVDAAGSHVVTLQGQGASAGASITPSFVLFGAQVVNTVSLAQTLTAKNTGTTPLTLNPISVSNNFVESDQCPSVLAPDSSCLISVSFAPTATGLLFGSLQFSDTSGQVATVVALNGQGALPGVATTPSALFFGSQPVGLTSQAQTVTVWNGGSSPLQILSVNTSGDFSETNTCSAIPVGGNCIINVTMTPTTVGTRTGEIQITDNADGERQISLSGVGQQPGVSLFPNSLAFGSLPYSASTPVTGTPLTVTLTNTGSASLNLSSISLTGDFTESDDCGQTVAAGHLCTLTVRFVPTALGHRTGTLTVQDDAGTQQISLAGDGGPFGLILTPPVINFGVQTLGNQSSSQTATLTNDTGQSLTSLVITPSGEFGETDDCGAALANGASCTIRITVTPASTGAITGAVTISTGTSISVTGGIVHGAAARARANAASSSTSTVGVVALSASAIPPGLQLSSPQLSFSVTSVGTASGTQTVTLKNTGTALPITGLNISETNTAEFPFSTTCTATLAPQASCTITVSFAPTGFGARAGTLNIVADGGISAAVPESGTASKGTPAVALSASVPQAMLHSAISLTAAITSTVTVPGGSIQFMDGTTALETVALTNGQASLTTTALAAGVHAITAVYSGDGNYLAATSNSISETVLDFTLASTSTAGASQTVIPGNSATYQLAITPTTGTTLPVAAVLNVSGLPSGATVALGTALWTQLTATSWQLPASTTLSNLSLTVHAPAQTTAARPDDRPGRSLPPVVLGVLLLPFARRLRQAGRRLAGNLTMLAFFVAALTAIAGLSGCASHNGFFGQAPQSYTVVVTVTADTVSHSTDLTLNVQ